MTAKTSKELQTICQVIDETVETEQIFLFGSHAYGTPRDDSDYDLYIVIPDSDLRPIDAAVSIRRALTPIQHKPLDVIVNHKSRFQQRCQGPTLERKITREGVLLYERQGMEQRMA